MVFNIKEGTSLRSTCKNSRISNSSIRKPFDWLPVWDGGGCQCWCTLCQIEMCLSDNLCLWLSMGKSILIFCGTWGAISCVSPFPRHADPPNLLLAETSVRLLFAIFNWQDGSGFDLLYFLILPKKKLHVFMNLSKQFLADFLIVSISLLEVYVIVNKKR